MADDDGTLWARTDRIFESALDLPPHRREAFLRDACGGDDELMASVLQLLEASSQAAALLDGGGPQVPREVLEGIVAGSPTEPVDLQGTVLDRYLIHEVIGRGGTSTVYRAERADGAFRQEVAIKVLRSDLPPAALATRVEQERQILATLSHPNIGGILDGGVTADGRPFLVMDLVDGQDIRQYADTLRLTVRDRLRLFLQVADAVQYAHRNLVVHRDLKPSNILMDREGRAVLLDFGIAKLLDPETLHSGSGVAPTRWMTPEYAAPEQILGEPVTTATDVYALGVVLHELLTGQRPFGDERSGSYEIAREVTDSDPRHPSEVASEGTPEAARDRSTTPARLGRLLEGDLDAIVLKALRKEPEARFSSVASFADDIRNFLDGRAVVARDGAALYHLRKLARRHRGAVAAAVVAALLLGGAGVMLARSESAANDAAQVARQEAANAQAAIGFLADMFKGRNPDQAPGDTITALQLLDWGEQRIQSEFDDNPALKAELLSVVAQAYGNLGLLEREQRLHEQEVELVRSTFGPRDRRVAEGLRRLGANLNSQRAFAEAVPRYAEALAIYDQTASTPPDVRADVLASLGYALRDAGQPDSAAVLLQQALEIRGGPDGEASLGLVRTQLALAYILRGLGENDEAEALYRSAIPRYRVLMGPDDPELPAFANNLAYLLRVKGRFQEAADLYEEALASLTSTFGRGHPNSILVARNLALTLGATGQQDRADSVLAESVSAARALYPQGHWRIGSALSALGTARLREGRYDLAEPVLEEATETYREQLGPDHFWTTMAEVEMAALKVARDGSASGQATLDLLYSRVQGWRNESGGDLAPQTIEHLTALITTLEAVGLMGEADRFRALLPGVEDAAGD